MTMFNDLAGDATAYSLNVCLNCSIFFLICVRFTFYLLEVLIFHFCNFDQLYPNPLERAPLCMCDVFDCISIKHLYPDSRSRLPLKPNGSSSLNKIILHKPEAVWSARASP